jgi:hypothetical protein
MPADPADIARYTQDGVALTFKDQALKDAQPNATDAGEIATFFRYRADAQIKLNERGSLLSGYGKMHEAVEIAEVLGIGTTISVVPVIPSFRIIDDERELNKVGRTRSVSFDMTTDRYSVEIVE